jgi:hypothetical protein
MHLQYYSPALTNISPSLYYFLLVLRRLSPLEHLVMRLSRRALSRCARTTACSEKVDEPNSPTRLAVDKAEAENTALVAVGASRVLVVQRAVASASVPWCIVSREIE